MRNHKVLTFALLLLLVAAVAGAQTLPVDLEVGYRWTDVSGNEDLYRTQINERDGFLIRSLTMTANQLLGIADQFRIDASDLGGTPAGSLRLQAGKTDLYRFTLGYRQADAYSALPGFANPFLAQGIIPGQHTFDRTRTMLDADLELLPGRRITPFVGVSYNRYDGPGATTYDLGGDEFRLLSDLKQTEREYRVGAGFNFGSFYGQATQGWRNFKGTEKLTLAPGAGTGNNLGTILGRPVTAADLTRTDHEEVDTPFTNVYVAGNVLSRVRLIGNYVRFTGETDATDTESATGSFVSFGLSRFFSGVNDEITANSKNTTWRGGARAEIGIVDGIDFLAGFESEHRSLEGTALLDTLYLGTLTFAGVDPRDVHAIINAESSLDRDEDVINAAINAHAIGPFSFRVGYTQTKQDVTVAPDLEEIVVPGNQGGDFTRKIDTIDTAASFAKAGFTLGAAYRTDSADDSILRTDFRNRDRVRARAGWTAPRNFVHVGVVAEQTKLGNDNDGVAYHAKSRDYTGEVEVNPTSAIRIRGAYSKIDADSVANIRRPMTFDIIRSVNTEKGKSIEGGIAVFFKPLSLDADLTRFENTGSIPFTVNRYRARLTFDLPARTGIAAEWAKDKYDEDNAAFANFDATRYGLYFRYRP